MPLSVSLGDAITEYTEYRRAHGDAANTVANHVQVLSRALREWGNIRVSAVEPRHVARLFTAGGWAPSTRNLYLSNLRQFFRWCRACNYMGRDTDPIAMWNNVRVPQVDKLRLPLHEFPALLDACRHPRDRAICALGLFTFCRGSEINNLRIDDLDLGGGVLHVYRQKTREEDTLPVSTELAGELTRYLNWYRSDQGILRGDWYLCPAKKPDIWQQDPATRRLVRSDRHAGLRPERKEAKPYRAVQRALRGLGYETRGEGEHTLRRSGARCLADRLRDEGYDGALLRVASMLGHKDTKITEHYIGWGLERSQRNEMFSGQAMFPELERPSGSLTVIPTNEGTHG